MNPAIAVLDARNPISRTLEYTTGNLTQKGYRFRGYSLENIPVLQEAISAEHWLAIVSAHLDKTSKREYAGKAKGGLIVTPAFSSHSEIEDIREAFVELRALDYVRPLDEPNLERAIKFAAAKMHLPDDFFTKPDKYCIDCLAVLAPRWRGSDMADHELQMYGYVWKPVKGKDKEHLANQAIQLLCQGNPPTRQYPRRMR